MEYYIYLYIYTSCTSIYRTNNHWYNIYIITVSKKSVEYIMYPVCHVKLNMYRVKCNLYLKKKQLYDNILQRQSAKYKIQNMYHISNTVTM